MTSSITPSLHTDRYELTMLDAALRDGTAGRQSVFEAFGRSLPGNHRFGVVAGIERVIDAVLDFTFDPDQIAWLHGKGIVGDATAEYLSTYAFSGNISGYAEGDLYFAHSPILRVEGTFAECVVLETLVLSILNHDTAVASTAARMVAAAKGRTLIEMGSRRTHEESAVHAARAACIAGFDGTSNLEAGYRYDIPTIGTAAHASILAHDDEREAFVAQIAAQGVGTTLLVDTYDIETGIETAVRAARQFGADGPGAIRIDSGDLLEGSIHARAQLDAYGCDATKIVVSGDLDEARIDALVRDEAPIDSFGVGTRLVTGANCPSPGFVYKLVAIENEDGTMRAVAKKSVSKATSGGTTYACRVTVDYLRDEFGIATAAESFVLGNLEDGTGVVEVHTKKPHGDFDGEGYDVQVHFVCQGIDVRAEAFPLIAARQRCQTNLSELDDNHLTISEDGPVRAMRLADTTSVA